MKNLILLLSIVCFSFSINAQDTFSITAIDTLTGEVGSAGASCIDDNAIPGGCFILSDVKPGTGVIHTQAYWNPANQNYASSLMDMGLHPQQIIDSLVANDVQNNPHIRQYGIIDLFEGSARKAAYTGSNCDDYKNHIIGPNYTIQGNILLGQQILDSMETRFLAEEGELACKLMAALQGAKVLGADTRCFDDGTSSLSAFLRVAQPSDPPDNLYLDLNIPSTPFGIDPIDSLQVLVDEWGGCYVSFAQAYDKDKLLLVYPNPVGSELVLKYMKEKIINGNLTIYNNKGEVVLELDKLTGNTIKVNLKLGSGMYFYQLWDQSTEIGKGKLMVN